MKKNLVLVFFIFSALCSYSKGLVLKGGLLLNSQVDSEFAGSSQNIKLDLGFKVDVSYDYEINKKIDMGFGFEFISSNFDGDAYSKSEFSQHPLYLQLKYNFKKDSIKNPYLLVRGGYPILMEGGAVENSEIKSKLYWALGLGMEIENFLIELLYEKSTFDEKYYWVNSNTYAGTGNSEIERISLSIGYSFGNRQFAESKEEEE